MSIFASMSTTQLAPYAFFVYVHMRFYVNTRAIIIPVFSSPLAHAALIHHPGVFFFSLLSLFTSAICHLLPDHKGCTAQVAPVAVKNSRGRGASWEMDLTREKCRQLGGEAELTSPASRWTPLSPLFFHLQLLMLKRDVLCAQLLGWTLLKQPFYWEIHDPPTGNLHYAKAKPLISGSHCDGRHHGQSEQDTSSSAIAFLLAAQSG